MTRRFSTLLLLTIFALSLFSVPSFAAKAVKAVKADGGFAAQTNEKLPVTRVQDFMGTGGTSDQREYMVGTNSGKPSNTVTQSLGFMAVNGIVNINPGGTRYDLGSNLSQPRQIAIGCSGNIHAVWAQRGLDEDAIRSVYSASFIPGSTAPTIGVASSDGGGFPSMTLDGSGFAAAAWHVVAGGGTFTGSDLTCADVSMSESLLYPDTSPTTSGAAGEAANNYIWPQTAGDKEAAGGAWFLHVVSHESPPTTDLTGHQSLVYWRSLDNSIDPQGATATFIDSISGICATICAHPDQADERVAIVYGKPRYYNLYTQGLNANENIVYRESTNGGTSWGPVTTIYNFAPTQNVELNATNPSFERGWEVSALYGSDNKLHVVFSTVWSDTGATFAGEGGYILSRPRRLYHWDSGSGCASVITERLPGLGNPCTPGSGGGMGNINKPSISECQGKFYVTYGLNRTIMGGDTVGTGEPEYRDCSDGNLQNWEIYAKASSTGGQTWGPDSNLTKTPTDGCARLACRSEVHLGTAERSTDSLRILYLEDLDAGVFVNAAGDSTMNPIKLLSVGCFNMAAITNVQAAPTAIGYPFNVPPNTIKDTNIVVSNFGNSNVPLTLSSTAAWMTLPNGTTPTLLAGCTNTYSILVRINTAGFPPAGSYNSATLNISYTAPEKSEQALIAIPVELHSFPIFYLPKDVAIRTNLVRMNVNQASEIANAEAGNSFSYFVDTTDYLFDGYLILGDAAANLTYSTFAGGGGTGAPTVSNPYGYLYAASDSIIYDADSTGLVGTRHASGRGYNRDSTLEFICDYYAPKHPDSANFMVLRYHIFKGPKNPLGTITNLTVGYYSDWDIPADTGADNLGGFDTTLSPNATRRNMLYQQGSLAAGVNDNRFGALGGRVNGGAPPIGGVIVANPTYIHPFSGWENDSLWNRMELLSAPVGISGGDYEVDPLHVAEPTPGAPEDLSMALVFLRDQVVRGDTAGTGPDTLKIAVIVAGTNSTGSKTILQGVMDRAYKYIRLNKLMWCRCGDADGNTSLNISDAVRLINFIFAGAAAPNPICRGDADGNGAINISDAVRLINYIFAGAAAPAGC